MICILPLLLSLLVPASAVCQEMKHILLLHSYHKGLTWTDSEDAGVRSVLRARESDIEVHTEYLDTKTISDEEHYRKFYELLKHKYAAIVFRVVIVSDDDAYNFYLKHHAKLFPGAPVVFCGVNYFKDSQREGRENLVTGVVEAFDIPETIRTALQLHPHTTRIVVINDKTTTGIANKKVITEQVIPEFRKKVSFLFLEDLTMPELLQKVRALPSDDLILLMTFNKDRAGIVFNYDQSLALIAKEAKVPIYGVWDFYLDRGIVGGMLTSGFDQGRMAAEMALRVLDGVQVSTIPVVKESPNRYKFDYDQLKRFGVSTSALPPGSIIINQPVSFYALHKGLVWGTLGGFLGLFAIIVLLLANIRQRRQGEEALRQNEEKYRTLVNNVNIGIYRNTPGPHGRFMQVNPALARIFGFESPEEMLDIAVSELYQEPEDRKKYIEEIQQQGLVKDKIIAMKQKDGTSIWCSVTARAQYDEQGQIKHMDSVLEDITERKRLEEQLRQSQKMEAIGNLAGGVAHDFNNILTAITGYGSLLRLRIGEGSPFKSYADEILAASERATHLTQSLLAFSRKQVIAPKPENLNEIVTRIEKLLIRVIGEDINFTIALCDTDLVILADGSQIEQVLMNLATNARDAMQDGGLLTIKTEHVDITGPHGFMKPGSYGVISVSDTGKGMDETTKLRIFEPFFTTKEKGKGTGLGLSIVYGIVKQHGGEINVYSELDKGTTFKIYFKLVDMKVEHPAASPMAEPQGGTETILLAEDDNEVRRLMKSILEEYGYTVITAVDGEDAVIKFLEHKDQIKFLLFDVVMPKKNGKEAYEEIGRIKEEVPILFASGYTADIIHKKGLIEEGLHFISKPVTPNLLLAKIRQIMDK
jgi:PAS domain S-box-containing protein